MADTVEPVAGAAAPVVEPAAAATAPAAPPPAAGDEDGDGVPDAVLRIPALQAVFAGSPPAISTKVASFNDRDEFKLLAENKDALLNAGLAFYRSLSGDLGVVFNAAKINAADIQAADKAGKLRMVAPDFDLVNHEVAKLGSEHPVFRATASPGLAQPVSATPPQASSGSLPLTPPAPASVQRQLAQQRVMNLQPGAPTSGPVPGAGRLLNQVLKPVT